MKTNITTNAIESTITVSKAFYKKASVYGSAEYAELHSALRDNPTFTIIFKVIEKKTYKALTFDRMRDYINTQPNSDAMLVKFDAVMRVAKAKNSLYPLTKKWFLNTFPSYKADEIADGETADLVKKAEAKAAEEKLAEAAKQARAEIANLIANDKNAATAA